MPLLFMFRTLLVLALLLGGPARSGAVQEAASAEQAGSPFAELRAENVETRRHAAVALRLSARSEQRTALPILIDLLMSEKDGQVRLAVLDTVTALGADAEPAIPALVHTLRTNYGGQFREELHQDYRSALALAAIGRPAVAPLLGLVSGSRENVRAEVIMALGRIGPDASSAVSDLVPLLGAPSERIRKEVALTLGRLGPAAIEPLIAASTSREKFVRAGAIESLGALAPSSEVAERTVLEAMRDEEPAVRAAALAALTKSKAPDDVVLPILKQSLQHQDEGVRLATVNLLVARPDWCRKLAPDLESLLTGEHEDPARHAAFLLSRIGIDAAPRLLEALARETSRIEQIAEALAQIGARGTVVLTKALGASDSRVRRGAALALGQIRPIAPHTVANLTAGLSDPDLEVRTAFLKAIGDVGLRAKESTPAIRALLQDPSSQIRLQATPILARLAPRDRQLVADLIAQLNDSDTRVQQQAIEILRSLGPLGRTAIPATIAKLGSSSAEVRIAAMEMLGSHGQAAAEAVPALSGLLDDPAPPIRATASRILGQLGKPAQPAQSQLIALTTDQDRDVRVAAVLALGSLELGADALRPPLARALRDSQPEVRRAALRVVQRQGRQAAIFLPDIILLAANKETSKSAERLLRQFERTGAEVQSVAELVQHLSHDQDTVRLLAIKFLAVAGRGARDAIPALERLRDDPNSEVRKQAEAASERIRQHSAPE